ncbi:HEPN domain-containing protein [Jannaschia rubra]|uniref:HEPN domain-containing protein n=1 Tax=Jannaschia rubra TaxID=282197 RepID=UPI0011605BE7|nr:HEPN domain-containing protein [Jannaschia rubra]
MKTAAGNRFLQHIEEADEAIVIYNHLNKNGLRADFALRFVWVSTVSALDDYITQLIIEISTHRFENSIVQEKRLLSEACRFDSIYSLLENNSAASAIAFRSLIRETVERMTFQSPNDVADGLSFIWKADEKWKKIGAYLGLTAKSCRGLLSSIANRRNLIVHNADFDDSGGVKTKIRLNDAIRTRMFIVGLVYSIEDLISGP